MALQIVQGAHREARRRACQTRSRSRSVEPSDAMGGLAGVVLEHPAAGHRKGTGRGHRSCMDRGRIRFFWTSAPWMSGEAIGLMLAPEEV